MKFPGTRLKVRLTLVLLTLGLLSPCFAVTAPTDKLEPQRKLVEQKIRLLEVLVNSPAARASSSGRDADAALLIQKGRESLEAARQALAANRLNEASSLLDATLKSASSASRKMSSDGSGLSESAQRKTLADMAEQVATYRASIIELTRDGSVAVEAQQLLIQLDSMAAESKQLAEGGRLGDANKKLASAYRLTIEKISKFRAGQEVVMSLKFNTPVDEYFYEQKRFGSNLIMVDMMIGEGRAEGQKRNLVDGFIAEGNKLKSLADAEANLQRHKEAVQLMEKATGQLNRALQSMGLPVF